MIDAGTRRWRLVRATAIPPSVRRFHARARARRPRGARPLIVAAVLVVLAGLGYATFGTSLLGVAHVEVRGAGFVGATDIRAAAAVRPGTPLLGLDTDAVARRVMGIVGVAHVDVSRHLPSTVVIDVRLRTAAAVVPAPAVAGGGAQQVKSFLLVDAGGVVFRTVAAVPHGVVVVDLAAPGPDDPSTQGVLTVLAALPARLRGEVDHITAATPVEIELWLAGGKRIVWGDATDNVTKARVALSLLGHAGTVIDVSAPNVVTVH